MTSKDALKRLQQETIPATYCKDFDKSECINIIAHELEILEILKKHLYINKNGQIYLTGLKLNSADYKAIKEWKENE